MRQLSTHQKRKKDTIKEEIVLKNIIDTLETDLINNPHDNHFEIT